jgi:hypothetical protein
LTRQRFPLDRLRPLSYIGASILLAGCPRALGPLVAEPLAPASRDSAVAWTRATIPQRPLAYRFRWLYRDERLRWPGRATARFAPPDSLRIDYVGALGTRAGAAVVVGDSVVWAEPSGDFQTMVPAIPLLWAGLGIVRPPGSDAAVYGAVLGDGATRTVWRFVRGADTLHYVAGDRAPRILEAEWRRRGQTVARSRTEYDAHAMPAAARIDFPEAPARFELTIVGIDSGAVALVPPPLWRTRR